MDVLASRLEQGINACSSLLPASYPSIISSQHHKVYSVAYKNNSLCFVLKILQ